MADTSRRSETAVACSRRRLAALAAQLRPVAAGGAGDEAETSTVLLAATTHPAGSEAILRSLPLPEDDTVTVRAATGEADLRSLALVTHYAFASSDDPDTVEVRTDWLDAGVWIAGGFRNRDGRAVSRTVAYPFSLGGSLKTTCGVAAVSAVGTLPDYRRRGLLRSLMTKLFNDMRQRGEAVSALNASQSAIYSRYGYSGIGANRRYIIDTVDIAFLDGDDGSCDVVRHERSPAVEAVCAELYSQFVRGRVCALAWGQDGHGGGGGHVTSFMKGSIGPKYLALATDATGRARGYVEYSLGGAHDRTRPGGNHNGYEKHPTRSQYMMVGAFVWLDIDAYRSMFTFLKSHDLVGRIDIVRVPQDDPAPVRTNPTHLRTHPS